MLPVDFLLMVNSIRGRILLIVCDIFWRKETENRPFGKYTDAKRAVYPFKVIKVIDFGTNRKHLYTFVLVINNNFSHILHRFGDMAA